MVDEGDPLASRPFVGRVREQLEAAPITGSSFPPLAYPANRRGIALAIALELSACTTPANDLGYNLKGGSDLVKNNNPNVPSRIQYLYGLDKATAQSMQAGRGLVSYLARQRAATPADSTMLAPDATLTTAKWVPCGTKPRAIIFDVDETVLLNLGFEYSESANPQPYSEARWQAWERKNAPLPGTIDALSAIRQMGMTIIFNSNRSTANTAATSAAIKGTGLGAAIHGKTMYLQGDDALGSKVGRRAVIAAYFCVLAMGDDKLGGFSDAGLTSGQRRAAVLAQPLVTKFGASWFTLPNPVYGTALKDRIDDIFPADKHWSPPATGEKQDAP